MKSVQIEVVFSQFASIARKDYPKKRSWAGIFVTRQKSSEKSHDRHNRIQISKFSQSSISTF
jgi:hypothetical protein